MTKRLQVDASGHVEDDLGTVHDGVVDAESSIEKRLVAEGRSSSDADSCVIEIEPRPAPFARSIIQQTVGKPSKKRSPKGVPNDYPRILPHNAQPTFAPSVGKRRVNEWPSISPKATIYQSNVGASDFFSEPTLFHAVSTKSTLASCCSKNELPSLSRLAT